MELLRVGAGNAGAARRRGTNDSRCRFKGQTTQRLQPHDEPEQAPDMGRREKHLRRDRSAELKAFTLAKPLMVGLHPLDTSRRWGRAGRPHHPRIPDVSGRRAPMPADRNPRNPPEVQGKEERNDRIFDSKQIGTSRGSFWRKL